MDVFGLGDRKVIFLLLGNIIWDGRAALCYNIEWLLFLSLISESM